jgi:Outer membrane lipoprotein-sorting protein
MMKRIVPLLFTVIIPCSLFGLDGTEIAQRAHDIADGETSHSAVQMDLIESNGEVKSRLIEEWGKDEGELTSIVMGFRSPASVKDTRYLQIENEGRDDDKWIYLPALKRVRRIASSDGDKSFMGSDASYDDMESREVERDHHELLREERSAEWNCYVVKAWAKDPDDSQYAYRVTWFDKTSYVPVRVEMFDKREELVKVLTVEELRQIQGYWTPVQTLMKNVQTGHATRLTFKKIVYDEPLPELLFSTAFLETGRVR